MEFRKPGRGQNKILQEKRPCGIAVIGFGCYYTFLKKIVNQRIYSENSFKYSMNLMPAGWAVRGGAWRAAGTGWSAAADGTARTQRTVFPFANFGNQLMGLFSLTFRAYGVGFFAKAQRNHFKLLFTFFAFIFVNRHTSSSLLFCFNLETQKENVNT